VSRPARETGSDLMPDVKVGAVRLPSGLEQEARKNSGLTYISLASLIRVSLAIVAGYEQQDALEQFARLASKRKPDTASLSDSGESRV
jgi:hypothetical protein